MIPFFDRFVDTREKRYHLALSLFLFCCICMVVPYLILGVNLTLLDGYHSLYAFLKEPYLEWTLLSRIIVDFISIANFTIPNGIACVLHNIQIIEVITIILFVLFFDVLEKQKPTLLVLILLVIEIIGSCAIALHALQVTTLNQVIKDIVLIGYMMTFINTILCILFVVCAVKELRNYKAVYCFDVEEIKEHME